jgi:hypothetical protein
MDNVVHRLARELAEVIGTGVSEDPRVEACREKARAAGYEMRISLEAVIGFKNRDGSQSVAKLVAPTGESEPAPHAEITANDRRFLRSLRIATGELGQEVE